MIPISLGEMISIHRTRHKMSQSDLAKAVGISRNYVSLIERGNENVSYAVVLKICEVIGLEISISMREAVEHQMHPTAFGVCPHGVNLGNQACVVCEPEKFGGG